MYSETNDTEGNTMSQQQKAESFQRLVEIREEMAELVHEAQNLVRQDFRNDYSNAEAYWLAHLKCALGDMGYPTYSTTFSKFLESNEEEAYEDEDYFE